MDTFLLALYNKHILICRVHNSHIFEIAGQRLPGFPTGWMTRCLNKSSAAKTYPFFQIRHHITMSLWCNVCFHIVELSSYFSHEQSSWQTFCLVKIVSINNCCTSSSFLAYWFTGTPKWNKVIINAGVCFLAASK